MKYFRPNREWGKWIVVGIGFCAFLNILFLPKIIGFAIMFLFLFLLLFIVYKTWVDWTYIVIDREQKTYTQISTQLYKKVFQLENIKSMFWTGSPLDGVTVDFGKEGKTSISPAIYDKETMREIFIELMTENPSVNVSDAIKRVSKI